MNVITLWQPYASLIMLGLKNNETRSWNTNIRGEIGIHASKKIISKIEFTEILYDYLEDDDKLKLFDAIDKAYGCYENMPIGAILGTVNLSSTERTNVLLDNISWTEFALGDYTPGRWAWNFKGIKPFDKIIPVSGSQGFWYWDCKLANPNGIRDCVGIKSKGETIEMCKSCKKLT